MDYRVKTSKDLAINLAHAKAVISACRVAIPRIAVSDEDEAFIRLRIMRMISELETIDKFVSKTAVTALPFASWPEALDLRNRFGWTGDLIFP